MDKDVLNVMNARAITSSAATGAAQAPDRSCPSQVAKAEGGDNLGSNAEPRSAGRMSDSAAVLSPDLMSPSRVTSFEMNEQQTEPPAKAEAVVLSTEEVALLAELDAWAKRDDAFRRIYPPKDATAAMASCIEHDAWVQRMSDEAHWSDEALALTTEQLLADPNMSFRLAASLAKHVISSRLRRLEASATRELMSAALALCTRYPRVASETVYPETLPALTTAAAEVLVRICKDCLDDNLALTCLQLVCNADWIEPTIRVAEELFMRANGNRDAVQVIIPAFEKNAFQLGASVRFGKLAMVVFKKGDTDAVRGSADLFRRALSNCSSFLARNIAKKLA